MSKHATLSFLEKAKGLIPYSVEWEALLRQHLEARSKMKSREKEREKRQRHVEYYRLHPEYFAKHRAANRENQKVYWKKRYAKDRRAIIDWHMRHYRKNRKSILTGRRALRRVNLEAQRAKEREHYKTNQARIRAVRRARARKIKEIQQ